MDNKVIVLGGHASLTTLCKMAAQERPKGFKVTNQCGGKGVVVDVPSEQKRPVGVSLAGLFGLKKKHEEESDEPQRG